MKSNISVIIPIHRLLDSEKELLKIAVSSVEQQLVKPDEILFIKPSDDKGIGEFISTLDITIKHRVINNDGETDFQSQINFGVDNVKTKYFTFLELDDELSKIWIKNAVTYIEHYPEVNTFLPIVVDVTPDNNLIGLTNEPVWAEQFSDEMGFLDTNSLLTYQNFNIDGMVMDVETYKEIGGLKSNIKISFIYEFLLRLSQLGNKILTIPKIGYKHVNQREGSLFKEYKDKVTVDESRWWVNQAKKEYFFTNDREITYEQ